MPTSLIPALLSAGSIATGLSTAAYLGGTFFSHVLISTAIGAALNALAPQPDRPKERGYNVTARGTNLDHQIVYGKARVGGALVFDALGGPISGGDGGTGSSGNEFLFRALAFAAHEIESYEDVYIASKKVVSWKEAGSPSGGTGITDLSSYVDTDTPLYPEEIAEYDEDGVKITGTEETIFGDSELIAFRFWSGTSTQVASTDWTTEIPNSIWTSNHRLRGIAYIGVRFKYDREAYPTGIPEVTTTIKGKKLYDPRKDSTNGAYDVSLGVSTHRSDDDTTWEWTDNPALCIRDYVASDYGLNEGDDQINDTLVASTADQCALTTTDAGTEWFTCNGNFTTGAQPYDILTDLLTSMGGLLWYAQGKWEMKPAYWTTPVKTFDEDDLRSSIKVVTRHSRRDNFNIVAGNFRGEETNWQVTEFPSVRNYTLATAMVADAPYTITSVGTSDFTLVGASANTVGTTFVATGSTTGTGTVDANVGVDGGQETKVSMDFPFTDNSIEARRISRIILERNRQQLTVSASFGLEAFEVKVGDNIYLTNERFGWSSKAFEVVQWSFGSAEEYDLQVQLVLREISSSVFDEVDDSVTYERDNTVLNNARSVPSITLTYSNPGYAGRDTVNRTVKLDTAVVTSGQENNVDQVGIYYKLSADSDYIFHQYGDLGTFYIHDLPPGTYDFKAVPINPIGYRGTAVTQTSQVVAGPFLYNGGYTWNGAFSTGDFTGWTAIESNGIYNNSVVERDSTSTFGPETDCPFEYMYKIEAGTAGGTETGIPAGDGDELLLWDGYIATEPGESLTVSAWLAAASATSPWSSNGDLRPAQIIYWYDEDLSALPSGDAAFVGFTDTVGSPYDTWNKQTATFVAPAGAKFFRVAIRAFVTITAVTYITGIRVTKSILTSDIERDNVVEPAISFVGSTSITEADNVEQDITDFDLTIPEISAGDGGSEQQSIQVYCSGELTFTGAATATARLYYDSTKIALATQNDDGGFALTSMVTLSPGTYNIKLTIESTDSSVTTVDEANLVASLVKR